MTASWACWTTSFSEVRLKLSCERTDLCILLQAHICPYCKPGCRSAAVKA